MRRARARSRGRVVAALAFFLALPGALATRAPALELSCIEPSRYRHLMQVFADDAHLFSAYFGLDKDRAPDPDACRALLASGSVKAGDAEALLEAIVGNKGWLAAVYLAAHGAQPEEEVKLAQIVRAFGLQTRILAASRFRYEPDFATRTPVLSRSSAEAELTQAVAMSSLDAGLRDYFRREDRDLTVPGGAAGCVESCIGVWIGGIVRSAPRAFGAGEAGAAPPSAHAAARLHAALRASFDQTQPEADAVSSPPSATRPRAPTPAQAAREACARDLSTLEMVAGRISGAVGEFARKDFKVARFDSLSQPFAALRRAGLRLQQCVAGALERERLARFRRLCPERCERERLAAAFAAAAREVLRAAARP